MFLQMLFCSTLSTVKYETNIREMTETFENISISSETADIRFVLSGDDTCKVECYEDEKAKHSVSVENNTLVIRLVDQKSWYDHIGFNLGSQKITVYLPKAEYKELSIKESTGYVELPKDFTFARADISAATGNINFFSAAKDVIKLKTNTGNIRVEDTSANSLDLSVTTGKVTVKNVKCLGDVTLSVSTGETNLSGISCENFRSNGTTGYISLNNVIAKNKLSVERSTGDVKFVGCDAAEIFVRTNTGDVTGSLLSDKVFITDTDTGHVDVLKTTTGGRCEIISNTGDIRIDIA